MAKKSKHKSKKRAKKTDKHGRKCKCDDCSEKRAGRKWNRRRQEIEVGKAQEERDRKSSSGSIGFLSGGHQNLKRDLAFEGVYGETDHLSDLHRKASYYIRRLFSLDGNYSETDLEDLVSRIAGRPPSQPLGGAKLIRAYQVDLDSTAFDAVAGRTDLLWHGTSFNNISSIGHSSLIVKGSHGLLGAGIYLTPDFLKAWGYAWDGWSWSYGWGKSNGHKTVLLCAVKLGKVLRSEDCIKHAEGCDGYLTLFKRKCINKECKWVTPNASLVHSKGYKTAGARSGSHPGAYGGHLRFNEYCCYNNDQVLPLYILVFKGER